MKAIVRDGYGTPDVLRLEEVERPTISESEALVRIHAASVNQADIDHLKGMSIIRMAAPFRPAHRILGSDIAGRVEAVGADVTTLQPGDEVFADLTEHRFGAFAEYVSVPATALAPKPAGLTFEQAAAVPSAGVIALQGLRRRQVEPGQTVLMNGAGGGMGTFAVQIAKSYGAEVTAVDRVEKLEMLRSIGADHVIDYRQQDFTAAGKRYDLILDLSAYRSVFDIRPALAPDGAYFMVGGATPRMLQVVTAGSVVSAATRQHMGILPGHANRREDIDELTRLLETGAVRPMIDSTHPLVDVPVALQRLIDGVVAGKAVITIYG
jgi:NADPH:quinone reductase-like Zn-dependent oxidoreductase